MESNISQKSQKEKDKEYQQTLEFIQQLKPLKERYKTELLKVYCFNSL